MIEQAKFLYSLLEKPNKKNWRSKKKQIKTLENHGKELAVPNELNKKDFNINKDGKPIEKQKPNSSLNLFQNLTEKINPNNLIYKCKTEETSLKDFSNYQKPIDLFIDLIDGNKNPREVLKDQINGNVDLGEIKKRHKKSKLKYQMSLTQNVQNFFRFKRKSC